MRINSSVKFSPDVVAGSQFRTVKTGLPQLAFVSGGVSTLELPRSLFKKRLMLRLSGTVSVTTNGSALVAEAPLRLIKRIELIGDGVKTLINIPANDAFRMAHILEGKQPELTQPTGFTVAANMPIAALIPLYFEALRMRKPSDSYLDPRGFESLQLKITWGTVADVVVGGVATVNAGTVIDVMDFQTAKGEDDIAYRRLVMYDETAVAGASTVFPINIPRNGFLAGVLIHADVDLSPSDALINNLTLKSDNMNLHADKLVWETLRKSNVMHYNIDSSTFGAGIAGYVYLDLTEDGMLSTTLNTYNLNTLQLIYDINASGTTRFVRHGYIFYEPINVG